MEAVASGTIDFAGHSDMDGRGDDVQVMVHRGHAYVGHGFSNGIAVLGMRDLGKPRVVNVLSCPPNTRASISGRTTTCCSPSMARAFGGGV